MNQSTLLLCLLIFLVVVEQLLAFLIQEAMSCNMIRDSFVFLEVSTSLSQAQLSPTSSDLQAPIFLISLASPCRSSPSQLSTSPRWIISSPLCTYKKSLYLSLIEKMFVHVADISLAELSCATLSFSHFFPSPLGSSLTWSLVRPPLH